MKKFLFVFFLVFSLCLYAEENLNYTKAKEEIKTKEHSNCEKHKLMNEKEHECKKDNSFLGLKVGGEIKFSSKLMNSYHNPFDIPEWGWDWRGGADRRESQYFRVKGNLNFYFGNPGVTEWFGVAQIQFDANDPDRIANKWNEDGTQSRYNPIEEVVEVGDIFLMWRPFVVQGGRPFGISAGIQSLKATANAAYTHYFQGDFDDDFIMYSCTGLLNKPMINLDFHIDANTGIGFAFGKGSSDVTQTSNAMDDDHTNFLVGYIEAQRYGFGLNAAYQMYKGSRGAFKADTTEMGNVRFLDDYENTSYLLNAQLSYNWRGIMPFIGIQKIFGDECPHEKYGLAWGYPKKEDIKAQTISGGLKVDFKELTSNPYLKNLYIAADYTDVSTDKFNGLGGFESGFLDEVIDYAGNIPNLQKPIFDSNNQVIGFQMIKKEDKVFKNAAGYSKNVYTISDLDAAWHFEVGYKINKNIEVAAFVYGLLGNADNTIDQVSQEDRKRIREALLANGYKPVGENIYAPYGIPDVDTLTGLLVYNLNNTIFNKNPNNPYNAIKYVEWEDATSFGLVLKYNF